MVPLPRGNVGPLPPGPTAQIRWAPHDHVVVHVNVDPTTAVPQRSVPPLPRGNVNPLPWTPPLRSHRALYPATRWQRGPSRTPTWLSTSTALRGSAFLALHSERTRVGHSYHYTRPSCAQPKFLFLTTAHGPGFKSAKNSAPVRFRTGDWTQPELNSYHCTTQRHLLKEYILVYLTRKHEFPCRTNMNATQKQPRHRNTCM